MKTFREFYKLACKQYDSALSDMANQKDSNITSVDLVESFYEGRYDAIMDIYRKVNGLSDTELLQFFGRTV